MGKSIKQQTVKVIKMDDDYQLPDIVKQKALNAENGGALFKFYVEEMINDQSLLDTLVFSWLNYTDAYPPTKYGSQLNRYNEKRKIYVVSFDNWKEAVVYKTGSEKI